MNSCSIALASEGVRAIRTLMRSLIAPVVAMLLVAACAEDPPPVEPAQPPPPAAEPPPATVAAPTPPPAEPTAEEKKKAQQARELAADRAKWEADRQAEAARWTPELHAEMKAFADKSFPTGKAAITAAMAGKQRHPGDADRDKYRHPAETLDFFGFKPTMTVLDIGPGDGWYTELVAPALEKKGSTSRPTRIRTGRPTRAGRSMANASRPSSTRRLRSMARSTPSSSTARRRSSASTVRSTWWSSCAASTAW